MTSARDRILVALAEVAWGYFRTRKQFLLERLAARGWRVVYCEPLASGRGNAWSAREVDGVTVVTVPFLKTNTRQAWFNRAIELPAARAVLEGASARAVRRAVSHLTPRSPDIAFISNIYAAKSLPGLGARLVCYDFNDHPLQFAAVPRWASAYLDRALAAADLVLAVSPHYQRELASRVRVPVVRLGNGVEFRRFAEPRAPVPASLARIPKPRLGYVGKVSHFLDFQALERLATTDAASLVILGPLPEETRDAVARLALAPGAHVLGEVPYAEVPAVLAGLDVGLVPFRAGDRFTIGINPNKIYQYWAAGLPVVSSPIADLAADGATLAFAATPDEFVARALELATQRPDPERCRERAMPHDWDAIAERLDALLEAALAAKESRGRVEPADVEAFGEGGSAR